jgi:hypothetical protein
MDQFSVDEFQKLTGLDRDVIDARLETLSEEPTLEELVAAFVGCKLPGGKKAKSPAPPVESRFSIFALAKLCNLDRATVADRLEGIPATDGPKNAKLYSLADAVPALVAGRDITLDAARLRKISAEAEHRELKLKEATGEMVSKLEVRNELQDLWSRLHRRTVINFAREIATDLLKCKTSGQLTKRLQAGLEKIFHELRTDHTAFR